MQRAFVPVAVAAMLSGCGINSVPASEENAKARWADVQAAYQRRADLIPNLVATVRGFAAQEQAILTRVAEAQRGLTGALARPGGAYVAKVLAGGADHNLVAELKRRFATVKHAKPPASRKGSSEWYVVAQGRKG